MRSNRHSPSCVPRIVIADVEGIEGEPLRFHVQSRSSPQRYFVDLEEYDGNGQCNCPNFQFKLQKYLDKFGHGPSEKLQCYHINRCHKFVAMRVVYAALDRLKESVI